MPASSHGLPTSLIRSTGAPQPGQAIVTSSIHGRCGVWPSKRSQPATARSRSSSRPPMTSTVPHVRAVVDRQRQAPVALLADHPVVHVPEPVELALVAEVGDPADLVDDLHDLVAQAGVDLLPAQRLARLVVDRPHADEPLVDEAEDERRAASPAVRVAVDVRLEAVEPPGRLEVLDDRLADVAARRDRSATRSRRGRCPISSIGATTGSPSALPSWKSSAPQPGAMWTMPVPSSSPTSSHGDDPVLVAGRGECLPDRRQLVERTAVPPAHEVPTRPLLEHLERTFEGRLERALAQPQEVVALADLDVAQVLRRRPPRRSRSASMASSSRPGAPRPAGRPAGSARSGPDPRGPGSPRSSPSARARSRSARTTASCRGPCTASRAGGTRRGTTRSGRCSRC